MIEAVVHTGASGKEVVVRIDSSKQNIHQCIQDETKLTQSQLPPNQEQLMHSPQLFDNPPTLSGEEGPDPSSTAAVPSTASTVSTASTASTTTALSGVLVLVASSVAASTASSRSTNTADSSLAFVEDHRSDVPVLEY